MSGRRAFGALALPWLPLAFACGAPELGELPARCADGACPVGYDCIHGFCARPGAELPITVARLDSLRGLDLKLVPEDESVLVIWQSYVYSESPEGITGVRVTPDGAVSAPMSLVRGFASYEGVEEPDYDVLGLPGGRLLVSLSAAPLPERQREGGSDEGAATLSAARILTYAVTLPPRGQEANGAQYAQAWPQEARVASVGYGAVSRPKLLARGDGRVELGYVRTSRRDAADGAGPEVVAELAVFPMAGDGALLREPELREVRRGMSLAVGVVSAFSTAGAAWWVLDDIRPSVVRVPDGAGPARAELRLADRFGIPVEAGARSLRYFNPSERIGNKLPSAGVSGEIDFHDVTFKPAPGTRTWRLSDGPVAASGPGDGATPGGPLPVVRDTPRPAWVAREGRLPLLVTPGAEIDAPELIVYVVDPDHHSAREARRIGRLSSAPLRATKAVVVGGNLFVAWLDGTDAASTVRMAVVPEP